MNHLRSLPRSFRRSAATPAGNTWLSPWMIHAANSIPGALAWLATCAAVWGALVAQAALLWSAALLSTYLALRFGLAALAWVRGLRLVRQWEHCNWRAEYDRRKKARSLAWQDVHHLVILPSLNESDALLSRSLDRLAAWPDAARAMTVVLAMEGNDPSTADRAARLQQRYATRFRRVLATHHPTDLPAEVRGKSANLAWATRHVRQTLLEQEGYSPNHIVVTVMDADTLWHPAYFDCLTTLFATDDERHTTFWQAPIRYQGNIWTAHWLMRPLHAQASAWELAYLAAPWWQALPMSSYSLSLHLLDASGGWATDAIADEWHMYLRSFRTQRGRLRLQPVYLPFLVHIVSADSALRTMLARCRQTIRHAWGAEEIGHAMTGAVHTRGVQGWRLVLRVAHDHLLAGAGAVWLGVSTQLPMLLAPAWWLAQIGSAPFILLQVSLLIVAAVSVIFWWGDRRSRPAPSSSGRQAVLPELAGLLLLPTITALCVTLPLLYAHTCLMLGKRPRFQATPKE